jgi:hypothetical protein
MVMESEARLQGQCPAVKALVCPAHNHNLAVVEQTAPLVERLSDERLDDLA